MTAVEYLVQRLAENGILKLDSVNMFWEDVKRYIKAIA